jgi:hypothetical protein
MKMDFEDYLRRQSIRPIPAPWRKEILRAARPQPQPQPAVSSWWREWLWPCPRAWAGLAAAWAFIFLMHLTTPDDPSSRQGGSASLQSFAFLQQETAIIAQLSAPEANRPAPPPPPAATKPRSSRRVKQSIG